MSNASRGAYYKARSKKLLLKRGLQVADAEILRTVYTPSGPICVKRDIFGSDLMYLAVDVVVFVQVKGGMKPLTTLVKDAQRAFEKHVFPVHTRRELHVWRPMARQPEIVTWP